MLFYCPINKRIVFTADALVNTFVRQNILIFFRLKYGICKYNRQEQSMEEITNKSCAIKKF